MRLGTDTGSFCNHMMSRGTIGQPEPVVGMGATVLCWTDRHAATIIAVETWRKSTLIRVTRDRATRIDRNGMSECQSYEYETVADGREQMFWFDPKRQAWRECYTNDAGRRCFREGGNGLMIGERDEYYDYSF